MLIGYLLKDSEGRAASQRLQRTVYQNARGCCTFQGHDLEELSCAKPHQCLKDEAQDEFGHGCPRRDVSTQLTLHHSHERRSRPDRLHRRSHVTLPGCLCTKAPASEEYLRMAFLAWGSITCTDFTPPDFESRTLRSAYTLYLRVLFARAFEQFS
jgi:hypothetical protein